MIFSWSFRPDLGPRCIQSQNNPLPLLPMAKDQSPALAFALILLGCIVWLGPWWSDSRIQDAKVSGSEMSEAGLLPGGPADERSRGEVRRAPGG